MAKDSNEGKRCYYFTLLKKLIPFHGTFLMLQSLTVPCFLSQRWILSYVGFWGFMMVYAIRVDFSVGIVCMVGGSSNSHPNQNVSSGFNQTVYDNYTTSTTQQNQGEFDWPKPLRSSLLAMYFYGYIILQIPGGWIATRFGGKRVLGYMTFVSSVATLLTPVLARLHVNALFAVRFIIGLAAGVSFPAMHSLWGRWAPPLERSKLMGLCYAGPSIGVILTYSVSGLLCVYGFDNGWGSIFYLTGTWRISLFSARVRFDLVDTVSKGTWVTRSGITGVLWCIAWYFLVSDTPQEHPRITPSERIYIEDAIGYKPQAKITKTPWIKMMQSPAVLACLTAHACNNWTNYTLLTSLPLFMREVLEFDIKQNGFLSAVPYLCTMLSSIVSGHIVDFIRQKGVNTTTVRRVVQIVSFVGQSSSLVAVGFVTKEHRHLAVGLLSLSMIFTGLNRSGYAINHVDFAPRYAGELFGITNTFATIPGMIAPIVVGLITQNKTVEEWRTVFYICAGISIFGAIIFGSFARGTVQEWGLPPAGDIELEIMKPLHSTQDQPVHKTRLTETL